MKRPWPLLLVTMAGSGREGAARVGRGPAALPGAKEGVRLRRGRGGHGRPSIDCRRLEFIRHKPGGAMGSLATEPAKSGPGRGRAEVGRGRPALSGSPGRGAGQ